MRRALRPLPPVMRTTGHSPTPPTPCSRAIPSTRVPPISSTFGVRSRIILSSPRWRLRSSMSVDMCCGGGDVNVSREGVNASQTWSTSSSVKSPIESLYAGLDWEREQRAPASPRWARAASGPSSAKRRGLQEEGRSSETGQRALLPMVQRVSSSASRQEEETLLTFEPIPVLVGDRLDAVAPLARGQ